MKNTALYNGKIFGFVILLVLMILMHAGCENPKTKINNSARCSNSKFQDEGMFWFSVEPSKPKTSLGETLDDINFTRSLINPEMLNGLHPGDRFSVMSCGCGKHVVSSVHCKHKTPGPVGYKK